MLQSKLFVVFISILLFGCALSTNKPSYETNLYQTKQLGTTTKFVIYEEEPRPIKKVWPEYSDFAQQSGLEGTVVVQAEVFEDGTVGAIEIVKSLQSGPGGLDELAIQSVKQWKFIPAKNQGKPIAIWVTFPIHFLF